MKIILHAPTPSSLARSRAEAAALTNPDDMVRIVASGDGAAAAVDNPDPATDHMLVVCLASLGDRGRSATPGMETTPVASSLIARLQRKGWIYLRL